MQKIIKYIHPYRVKYWNYKKTSTTYFVQVNCPPEHKILDIRLQHDKKNRALLTININNRWYVNRINKPLHKELYKNNFIQFNSVTTNPINIIGVIKKIS
jgi:hypothetical protein